MSGSVGGGGISQPTGLLPSRNLSDVQDATAARNNLGLKGASTLDVGNTTGTVAAGDDARIVGAVQHYEIGPLATMPKDAVHITGGTIEGVTLAAPDIESALGYVPMNPNTASLAGDVTGPPAAAEVTGIKTIPVQILNLAVGDELVYDGTEFHNVAQPSTLDAGFF